MRSHFFGLFAVALIAAGGCPGSSGIFATTPTSTSGGASGGSTTTNSTGSSGGSAGSGSTSGAGVGGASGTSTGGGSATIDDADRVVELVNIERTSRGLSALTRNDLLDAAAEAHANDMGVNGFFSHTGSDGSDVGDRATAAGYAWTRIGENIASGQPTPEDVMDSWMNSDGHRANILNPDFTEIGIGIYDQSGPLWVQVFGTPQ